MAGIQLATLWPSYTGMKSFVSRASAKEIEHCQNLVRALSTDDIESLFCAVHNGSDLAIRAGFGHIQLHAAHGYLISLLIDCRIYPDADIVLAAIADWAKRCAACGVETSIRVSLRTGDAAFDAVSRDAFIDQIVALPVTYVKFVGT